MLEIEKGVCSKNMLFSKESSYLLFFCVEYFQPYFCSEQNGILVSASIVCHFLPWLYRSVQSLYIYVGNSFYVRV